MNPTDFAKTFQADQWIANATGYARTFMNELEKQAERWTEYGLSQSTEAARLARSLQTQAFGIGKSMLDTAEKTFGKAGA